MSRADCDSLVALLCEVLSTRAGEKLTPEVITERARNAAMALVGEYEMRPRVYPPSDVEWNDDRIS
jgi:hypothetical protein